MTGPGELTPGEPSRAIVFTSVALGSLLFISACTPVAAYQRGALARPCMDPSREALEESFHSHVEAAREGAAGGHGVLGGGCGCG